MSEPDFHFTFHFSNFQYPLSQDTGTPDDDDENNDDMKKVKMEVKIF